jgi:hypothetical protein
VGVAPVTCRAPVHVHQEGAPLAVSFKHALGTELDTDAASFAPGAKDRDVTSSARGTGPFLSRSLNGGWIRRFFRRHIEDLPTTVQRVGAARNSRSIVPPAARVSTFEPNKAPPVQAIARFDIMSTEETEEHARPPGDLPKQSATSSKAPHPCSMPKLMLQPAGGCPHTSE